MANSSTSQSNRGGQTLVRILIGSLVCVAICLILVFCVSLFGYVSGEEFDPISFQRRTFNYYELPLVGIQVIPVTRKSTTTALEKHVSKLLKLSPGNGEDWHVVSLYRSAQKYNDGDAALLCSYLDVEVGGGQEWLNWSKKHPTLAKVLWPAVADLARRRMYIFIPRLMESAKAATEPVAFREQVNRYLAERYSSLAAKQAQLNKHLLAVSLFDQALVFHPQDEQIQALRAASFGELSDAEKTRLAAMQTERNATFEAKEKSDPSPKPTAEKPAN